MIGKNATLPLRRGKAVPAPDAAVVLGALAAAVVAVDKDGTIQFVNGAAEQLFASSATYLCGQPVTEFLPPDSPILSLISQARDNSLSMAEHGVARWAELPDIHRPAMYELVDVAIRGWLGSTSCPGFAARHGFHVLDDLRVDAYQQHRIPRDNGTRISLSTVDLSGTLEVSEPARFVSALLGGVGHGKAFGCGLLLVRRP